MPEGRRDKAGLTLRNMKKDEKSALSECEFHENKD